MQHDSVGLEVHRAPAKTKVLRDIVFFHTAISFLTKVPDNQEKYFLQNTHSQWCKYIDDHVCSDYEDEKASDIAMFISDLCEVEVAFLTKLGIEVV